MSGARLLPDPAPDALAERAGVQAAARDLLEAVKREVAIYAPHQVETGFVAAQALQAVLEAAPDDRPGGPPHTTPSSRCWPSRPAATAAAPPSCSPSPWPVSTPC